jgi:hypothetical protein
MSHPVYSNSYPMSCGDPVWIKINEAKTQPERDKLGGLPSAFLIGQGLFGTPAQLEWIHGQWYHLRTLRGMAISVHVNDIDWDKTQGQR